MEPEQGPLIVEICVSVFCIVPLSSGVSWMGKLAWHGLDDSFIYRMDRTTPSYSLCLLSLPPRIGPFVRAVLVPEPCFLLRPVAPGRCGLGQGCTPSSKPAQARMGNVECYIPDLTSKASRNDSVLSTCRHQILMSPHATRPTMT